MNCKPRTLENLPDTTPSTIFYNNLSQTQKIILAQKIHLEDCWIQQIHHWSALFSSHVVHVLMKHLPYVFWTCNDALVYDGFHLERRNRTLWVCALCRGGGLRLAWRVKERSDFMWCGLIEVEMERLRVTHSLKDCKAVSFRLTRYKFIWF